MNKVINTLITVMFLSAFTACDKDEVKPLGEKDYLIFGTFYGQCAGEGCVELFKIEEDRLLEDKRDSYPGSEFYSFDDFDVLSQSKFDSVKDLTALLPNSLRMEDSGVFGMPDAGDWGGAFVEYKKGNVHKYWLLDQMDNNMPSDFNAFVDRINEKVAIIHE